MRGGGGGGEDSNNSNKGDSYLVHFFQCFISLLESISYLKLDLSKLNILNLLLMIPLF